MSVALCETQSSALPARSGKGEKRLSKRRPRHNVPMVVEGCFESFSGTEERERQATQEQAEAEAEAASLDKDFDGVSKVLKPCHWRGHGSPANR